MKKITIQDIAAQMGLSRNTVAKALNGGVVSEQTKRAVVQKAWEMGYAKLDSDLLENVQNQLKRNKSGTILVLFNHWESVFWNKTLAGISNGASQAGYRMQLHIVDEQMADGAQIRDSIADDVQGIIFLCVFPIEFVREIAKAGLPMTFLNTPVYSQEYIALGDVINVEGFYAMNRLTSYVIEKKGCKNLSFIGFAEGSRVVQARYLGYLSAYNQHSIKPDDSMQFTKPSNGVYFGYSAVEETINNLNFMPEAFICENDDIAKYVALVLLQKDSRLARDIVITGFDHTIEDDFFKKDIITVEVRMEELGRRLVKSIIDRVENPQQDLSFITIATYPLLENEV